MAQQDSISIVTGKAVSRVDGPLKVSGKATYTSDVQLDRMTYAVPVGATIARGKIKHLDTSVAQKMKGVLGVYSHGNAPTIYRSAPPEGMSSRIDEARPAFEDEEIRYYGQYIAVVVAETLEIAIAAANSVKATYAAEKPNVDLNLKPEDLEKEESKRGDAKAAFSKAPVKIEYTYVTPMEVHNPIEMHATTASWDGDKLTMFESSQAVSNHQSIMSQMLNVPKEDVRVISRFLGSGFGGKLWPWSHSPLAGALSRKLKRPVKLVVDRTQMFTSVGHRPRTQQTMRLSADEKGHLLSLEHDYVSEASMLDSYKENCGETSGSLYNIPSVTVNSAIARRNKGTPTSMRGPGAVPGLFALESAMDEMAIALKMDPVQFRILNDSMVDQSSGSPYSSRHLKECLELGARKFGWEKRNAQIGSMKSGDEILGWGVAACTWQAKRLDAIVGVELHQDGIIRVRTSAHDIGTGMYTVLNEIVHEETGWPKEKIEVQLGDTDLPMGPLSGGSMATASVIPATVLAVKEVSKRLISTAAQYPTSPFHGEKPDDLKFEKGSIHSSKTGKSLDFAKLMEKANIAMITGLGTSKGTFGPPEKGKPATKSFGAHFIEIGWNPSIARLRVKRVVTVIDAGRIINFQPAKNQIEGAIVMGIGMGMFEHAEFDARYGDPVNKNLADYIVAVHADCPEIDVTFLDYPDKAVNEYGARGLGEIGLAGVAPAITAAVYHATGVRVRELPVRIEDLIGGKA
jgi:xanthine dehydrogenase YagR molybdenum-binding subunit